MRRSFIITAIVIAQATVTHADGVANELSAGRTLSTPDAPATSWIGDRISGYWDVDPRLQLRLDVGVTRTYPAAGTDDPTTASTSSLSASYDVDDYWSLSLVAGWSPATTTSSVTTLLIEELEDDFIEADAQLTATSTMASLAISVGYATAGDSESETSVSLSLGVNHFQSQQAFSSIVDDTGEMLTTELVRDYCATTMCSPEIEAALFPLWTQISQLAIDASVVRTEYDDVDLALDASYFLYDKDPTLVGFRTHDGLRLSHLGNGAAVSPLRYSVSPSIANRWGKLMGTMGLAYGSYVKDLGSDLTASLKVQYTLAISDATRVRLHSRLASSWGIDASNELTTSLSMSLGGNYSW